MRAGSHAARSLAARSWAPALIAAAAVVPYLGILDAPFVFDDVKLVKENPLLRARGGEGLVRVLHSFAVASRRWDEEGLRENYRPLRFVSYLADYRLSAALLDGFDPADPPTLFFHLQNVLWHALNALLLYVLGRRLLGSRAGGVILGVIFALHPLATEAVTYISGRRDVLSTCFFLAGLVLAQGRGREGTLGWPAVLAAPLCLFLGFLAKEMAVTLPAAALLLDLASRPRWDRRRGVLHALLWAAAAGCVWVTLANPRLVASERAAAGPATVLWTACRYAARYLGLCVLPLEQSVDYSYDAIPATRSLWDPPGTWLAVTLCLGLLGAGAWSLLRRRGGLLAVGIFWFLGTLAPVLQFVPIAERFAERFAYLPAAGVFLLAALGLERLGRRRPAAGLAAAALLVAALFGATWRRNQDWRSPLALWGQAVEAQPRCARAHLAYGNALKAAGLWREAAAAYSRALGLWEGHPEPLAIERGLALQARMMRGGVRALLGRQDPELLERAVEDLQAVLGSRDTDGTEIAHSPRYALLHYEIAECLMLQGELERAAAEYRWLLETAGAEAAWAAPAHYGLGKIQLFRKDVAGAAEHMREALERLARGDPRRDSVRLELVDLLVDQLGEREAAWKLLEAALAEEPVPEVRVGILLRMAKVLDREGEIEGAQDRLREALAIDPEAPAVLLTLAGIEANLGRLDEAEAHYRRVLRRDPVHEGALEGLRQVVARRRLAREEGGEAEERKALAGLWEEARRHEEEGRLVAARQVYAACLRKAGALEDRAALGRGYRALAALEERLGKHPSARRALERSLEAEPEHPEALLALGDLWLRRLGDREEARHYYERYLAAGGAGEDPDPRALVNLGTIVREEDPLLAVQYYERARRQGARLGAKAAEVDLQLGHLHAELGAWEASFDAFQRYLALTEEDGSEETRRVRESVTRVLNERVIPRLIGE